MAEARTRRAWVRHTEEGSGKHFYVCDETKMSAWLEPMGWDAAGPDTQHIADDPLHNEL